MRGLIFLGGDAPSVELSRAQAALADFIVAADSGLVAADAAGISVDLVVGDFDSAPKELISRVNTRLLRLPARKDQTDGEEALDQAMDAGCTSLVLLGGFGGRLDHQLANISLLARARQRGITAVMADESCKVYCFNEGSWRIDGASGDILSLMPMSDRVYFISTQGLEYPLVDSTLTITACRGISNVFEGTTAEITIGSGMVAAVYMHEHFV